VVVVNVASPNITRHRGSSSEGDVWRILADVPDPEIPVLSVVELGIIRYVRVGSDERVTVGVSPTYTGCPATEVIAQSIRSRLEAEGYRDAKVESVLSPAWTSDWLTDSARSKLKDYGIAPPAHAVSHPKHLFREPHVCCPRCNSAHTEKVSEFASTPCKALYRCRACLEPFEYFKCI
jgi:ring-1,2-phenylacetyl-CoA epoxidase subunit PaaD